MQTAEIMANSAPRPRVVERNACPGCGAAGYRELIRQTYRADSLRNLLDTHYEGRASTASLAPYDYWLVRCERCRLGYQKTIPSDELVNEIYEQWIPHSERERLRREYSFEDYCYWGEQIQFVIQQLRKQPCQVRVLDFGMGWAEFALMAKAYGCEVAGAELSEVRIRNARSLDIEVVTWDDIPARRFDFINTEQVFEHLTEPFEVLQHLARALEAGGLLKISVPDSRHALRTAQRVKDFGALPHEDIMGVHPLEHINSFEHDTMVHMARRAGLRIVRPSLRQLYNSSSGWLSPKRAARQLLRPLYRHVYPKSTYAFFTRG
jgi:2-polyprenyl-3-methyl-5-hydroxy-6-metoxy-1,4-benzoquinol methylase